VWHPRGFTRFCFTWQSAFFCVYEDTAPNAEVRAVLNALDATDKAVQQV
jgi:hypothetical protein